MSLRLWLPFPPSVNGLFAGKSRRHKSEAYQAWIAEAKASLCQQHFMLFDKPVEVKYIFGRPDKRKRDLFNLEKAISDILVSGGVLLDDSLIYKGTVEWGDIAGCQVEIFPYEK